MAREEIVGLLVVVVPLLTVKVAVPIIAVEVPAVVYLAVMVATP